MIIWILLIRTMASSLNTEDILETIIIEEGRHMSHSLANLSSILLNKQRISAALIMNTKIYAVSDSRLLPFTIKDGASLCLGRPIDRESACLEAPSRSVTKVCPYEWCCKLLGFQYHLDSEVHTFFILVKITDVNDNAPRFKSIKQPYVVIPENIEDRYSIDLPIAEDADSPLYGVLRYSIEQTIPSKEMRDFRFLLTQEVPPKSKLIVATGLDYERTPRYMFLLTAYDTLSGTPGNNASTMLEIEIEDLNDNTPKFEISTFHVSIKENEVLDHVVEWKVQDADSGKNGAVNVYIDNEDMAKRFQVTSTRTNEGFVSLITALDYEDGIHLFKFNLVARDNGVPPRSSTATVEVRLTNVNDNFPRIIFKMLGQSTSNTVQLREGLPAHSLVAEVRVSDEDNQLSGIICSLIDSTDLFYLDQPSQYSQLLDYKPYNLKTIRIIDRESEQGAHIRVTVQCSDEDPVKRLTSKESLNVQVKDVNDNPPIFQKSVFLAEVEENQINAQIRFTSPVIVTDKDAGVNGKLQFYISDFPNSTESWSFICDMISVKISTRRALDFEEQRRYSFRLFARDLGVPSLSGSATIVVNVVDVNDNYPLFPVSQYSFGVSEDAVIGNKVGVVLASDNDSSTRNKEVLYEIEPGVVGRDYFIVDKHSGIIRTRKRLDREVQDSFTFRIIASNPNPIANGLTRDSTSGAYVIVKVTDINDNPPQFKLKPNLQAKIEFVIEQYIEGSTCAELPYSVLDPDDGGSHCCAVSLESDHDKLFSITTINPPSLCILRPPLKPQSITLTLIAKDRPGDKQKSRISKISLVVHIRTERTANNRLTDPMEARDVSRHDSRNLITLIILATIVLSFLVIVVIVVVIVRRSSFNDSDGHSRKVESLVKSANTYGYSQGVMAEQMTMQHCSQMSMGGRTPSLGSQASPQYSHSYLDLTSHNPPLLFNQTMPNQGIHIFSNPRSAKDLYSYQWCANTLARKRLQSASRITETCSLSDHLQPLSEPPTDSDGALDQPLDRLYHVLNQSPDHLLSQIHKDNNSTTLHNDFFQEEHIIIPDHLRNESTTRRNYFQSTFV